MYQIIDGKAISTQLKDELKIKVEGLKAQGKEPCLAVILVGEDPASTVYVGNKKKACESLAAYTLAELPPANTVSHWPPVMRISVVEPYTLLPPPKR